MTALIIISGLSLLAAWAFAYAQSKDQAKYVRVLHDEHNRERDLWFRERQLLLNRLRPETTQYVPTGEQLVLPPDPIGMDQDDKYWPDEELSREDLAAAMMAQEVAERSE
jgi:hypothetical protein